MNFNDSEQNTILDSLLLAKETISKQVIENKKIKQEDKKIYKIPLKANIFDNIPQISNFKSILIKHNILDNRTNLGFEGTKRLCYFNPNNYHSHNYKFLNDKGILKIKFHDNESKLYHNDSLLFGNLFQFYMSYNPISKTIYDLRLNSSLLQRYVNNGKYSIFEELINDNKMCLDGDTILNPDSIIVKKHLETNEYKNFKKLMLRERNYLNEINSILKRF